VRNDTLLLIRSVAACSVQVATACHAFDAAVASDADLTALLARATAMSGKVIALLDALAPHTAVYEAHSRALKHAVTMLLMLLKALPREGAPARDRLADSLSALAVELETLSAVCDTPAFEDAVAAPSAAQFVSCTPCALHAATSGCTTSTELSRLPSFNPQTPDPAVHWVASALDNVREAEQLPPTALAMLHIAGVSTAQLDANLALVLVCLRYDETHFVPSVEQSGGGGGGGSAQTTLLVSDYEAQLMRDLYQLVGAASVCDVGRSFLYCMPDGDGQPGGLVAVRRLRYETSEQRRALVARVALLERATPHRNIVTPFALADFKAERQLWLVTEHLPGVCLGAYLKRVPLADDIVAYVTLELMRALAHLHSLGIAHRRVAPTSVMVCDSGAIKLVDFSCCADTMLGASHERVGALAFMSPEMVRGDAHGLPTDVWSLGMCVLWMYGECTAQFDGAVHAFVSVVAGRTASQRRTAVARDFLSSCLRVRPEQRASVAALLKHEFLRDGWKGTSERQLRMMALDLVASAHVV
jgi:serine/threonine protein kinase